MFNTYSKLSKWHEINEWIEASIYEQLVSGPIKIINTAIGQWILDNLVICYQDIIDL